MAEKLSKLGAKPVLPVTRITTIMKSCSEVETVSQESAIVMSKATEMFLHVICQESFELTKNDLKKKLDYKNLSDIVHKDEKYSFLRDILPKKITVLEYKKIMAKKQAAENGEDEDSSETESSSGEDDSSSDDSGGNSSGKDFQKSKKG